MARYTIRYSSVLDCRFHNLDNVFDAENDKEAIEKASERWVQISSGKERDLCVFSKLEKTELLVWGPDENDPRYWASRKPRE